MCKKPEKENGAIYSTTAKLSPKLATHGTLIFMDNVISIRIKARIITLDLC